MIRTFTKRTKDELFVPYSGKHQKEPNLLIPGRKPIGSVEINKQNDLTENLVFCYASSRFIDLVSNTPSNQYTSHGAGKFSGYFDRNMINPLTYTLNRVAMTLIVRVDTEASGVFDWWYGFDTWICRVEEAKLRFYRYGESPTRNLSLLNRGTITVGFIYDGYNVYTFVEGVDSGWVSSGSSTTNIPTPTADFQAGIDVEVSPADCPTSYVFLWADRVLSSGEMLRLLNDPYQLVQAA